MGTVVLTDFSKAFDTIDHMQAVTKLLSMHSDRWKYVDDLSLGENRHVSKQSQLQNQVDSLEEWSGNAGLKLNPDKCMTLTAATIEQVQKRACRTILGKHYTDYASALQQCGLETLENRRVNLCRKFAVSMEKSERTADLLPPTRGQSTQRELRNSTKRTLPTTRTTRCYNSPLPSL
ncbi:hypothetical protein Bbelb_185090 [Branchiostoma belcheri]|nr:hypothetical protein Bbelb_185090 [Branchiostoma belcheri]